MPKSRKTHTPKAHPKAPARGEWVSDELPPAVLEHARKIRVYTGRSYRKVSDEALRQIGEALSFYRQTAAPPPQVDVAKAGELREVIADLFERIDNIDDGLALALAVAWQRQRHSVPVPADLPEPVRLSFDGWPAARRWLRLLDAGLESAIDAVPGNAGGRPAADTRYALLARVEKALADDGLPDPRARDHAADLLREAGIQLPSTPRRVRAAANRGGRKP